MFTGIINSQGQVMQVQTQAQVRQVCIQTDYQDLSEGESIAINGVCVTVVAPDAGMFRCDLSPETLSLTTLVQLQTGSIVNLERALRLSDRLGGQWVSGHVDQVACIKSIQPMGDCLQVQIAGVENEALSLLVHKGSITVNGVSLTINEITDDGFSVCLIPQTLTATNLSDVTLGDTVNLEFDTLVKIVQRQLTQMSGVAEQLKGMAC
jgi:riboflavin synthase